MTLGALLEEVEVTDTRGSLVGEISGIAYDSRRVTPGAVFFGLAGAREDGARFARAAFEHGAVAAVVARGSAVEGGTVVEVEEPRLALARAAARFHGHPERALRVVGVTGTNGKTTTTWMMESIVRAAGLTPGVIGTTGVRLADERRPSALTTPESLELFGLLREMVARGVQVVAIEVSSHALVQRRTFGIGCEVAVFTNLSRDHLDYHGTMERYLDAKLMLFDGRNGSARAGEMQPSFAVVNADDPHAAAVIAAASRGGLRVLRYGFDLSGQAPAMPLDVSVEGVEPGAEGLDLQLWVETPKSLRPEPRRAGNDSGGIALRLPLLGRHNAANAAAAFTAALALRIPAAAIVRGLESMPAVPGRLETVDEGQPFLTVVDYAHTPDALERSLAACREHGREHGRGRVLLVFGCGGDRDRGKRPLMGVAAARGSDRAWVTNDNPRSEDPAVIAAEIVAGAPAAGLKIELDRRRAITAALAAARDGDVVLIAGKGHETTQTIGDQVLPFDDRAVAHEALRSLAAGRP
jgi:UDP-N-acetylmuramoyl-L-alanyl-D-glutamate--2,6-diaminopimelate ligase